MIKFSKISTTVSVWPESMLGYRLFSDASSIARAELEETFELRGTDNVQGQIYEYIFAPNEGSFVWHLSNLFWYDFKNKQICPFFCNNRKTLSNRELNS